MAEGPVSLQHQTWWNPQVVATFGVLQSKLKMFLGGLPPMHKARIHPGILSMENGICSKHLVDKVVCVAVEYNCHKPLDP